MTRKEANEIIYKVINSGIIDIELEEELTDVCEHICSGEYEQCDSEECDCDCDGCRFNGEKY